MSARGQNTLPGDARRGEGRRVFLAALVIVLAGAIAYASSFSGQFVFDDNDSIVANTAIRHLWPPWRFFGSLNRPVVNLTLAMNYAIGGLRVGSYHAFNLAVHVLAALTLFGLVRRTLLHCRFPIADCRMIKEKGESTTIDNRQSEIAFALAFAVALIWELHPLQTEAVTYVIQRAESLAGLFCLLTLYCVLRGAESDRPWRWGACAFLACALGMATKQTVAAAPILVFLYDRAFLAGSFREALRKRWPVYAGLAATWLLLVPSAVTAAGRPGLSAGFQMSAISPARYAVTELGVVLHYLRLAFWPGGLCVDYFWPAAQTAGDILPGAAVVGALLAATAAAVALRPIWGFLGAWFFLALAPTSSIMPIADAAAERRMYLPLAAVIAFVVIGGYALAERLLRRRTDATGRIGAAGLVIAVALVIAAMLGTLTARRNLVYRSELSIWNDTVRKRPENPRAYNGLALIAAARGDFEGALRDCDKVIELGPNIPAAWCNRAIVYNDLGRYDKAIRDCGRAIELKPGSAMAYETRAEARTHQGDYDAALRDYDEAIRLNPDDAKTYNNRGIVLNMAGRLDEALRDFNKGIELNPDYATAFFNRGLLYTDKKDHDRALSDFNRAIELKPDLREAYYSRAGAHFYKGDYRAAWADVRRMRALGFEPPEAFVTALRQAMPAE